MGDSRGQSLMEMALILPALLMCLLGVLDLGRAVYAEMILTNAVRDGARMAIVTARSNAEVQQAVVSGAVGVGLTTADVTIAGTRAPGTVVKVSVTYTFVPVTPFIGGLTKNRLLLLRAQSSMVVD